MKAVQEVRKELGIPIFHLQTTDQPSSITIRLSMQAEPVDLAAQALLHLNIQKGLVFWASQYR